MAERPSAFDPDEYYSQAIAAAELRGQMKHITAEMMRGDQPLEAKEELIADLRARLSHVEAERDDLCASLRDLAEGDLWEHADAIYALIDPVGGVS